MKTPQEIRDRIAKLKSFHDAIGKDSQAIQHQINALKWVLGE